MASISAGISLVFAAWEEPWAIAVLRRGALSPEDGAGAAAAEVEASPGPEVAAAADFQPRFLLRSDKSVTKGRGK